MFDCADALSRAVAALTFGRGSEDFPERRVIKIASKRAFADFQISLNGPS